MEIVPFDIRQYKDTRIMTIDEIRNRLDELDTFKRWYITTNPGRKNILVYRHEITFDICVVKTLDNEEDFKLVKELIQTIDELDEKCKKYFVKALITPRYFVMEYWHATVSHFMKYDLNFSEEKWDLERAKMIYAASKGAKCLLAKGFYYLDMKADNLFVRYRNSDPQDKLSYALGDLSASKSRGRITITYKPPEIDRGYSRESLLIWGILVLIIQVWTLKPNSSYPFELYADEKKILPLLSKIMPRRVFELVANLYHVYKWDYSKEDTSKILDKIMSESRKRIELYLSRDSNIKLVK